mmetsp:Transcript_178/g.285  ORF Transcript_178/g.285 Transcript_178/m.285 type:complete len:83 (-) Transcript_178:237-485(-)
MSMMITNNIDTWQHALRDLSWIQQENSVVLQLVGPAVDTVVILDLAVQLIVVLAKFQIHVIQVQPLVLLQLQMEGSVQVEVF